MSTLIIMNMYAIYDEKAMAYNVPFCFQHDGQATRAFQDEAERSDSAINTHPGDYKLYRVGSFDQQSGKLEGLQETVFLMSGDQVINQDKGE